MTGEVVVTGASGFVGRHLVTRLAADGIPVHAVGRRAIESLAHLPLVRQSIVPAIDGDTDWSHSLVGARAVIHLAGVAHRLGVAERSQGADYHAVNVLGTARLAKAVALQPGIRRMIFVSSVAVTGSSSDLPITERTPPNPDSSYGQSKLDGELAIERVLGGTPADWCVIRPPLVYGPGNPGNMARLVGLLRTGVPLPLGGLKNRRNFLFVQNLVDLLVRLLEAAAVSRRCFVAADTEIVSTTDLLKTIGRNSELPVRLFHVPDRALRALALGGDAASRVLGHSVGVDSYSLKRLLSSLVIDDSLIRRTLGWIPPVTLEEGLRQTLGASSSTP